MAQNFPETAHLKTDMKKYQENFDRINWNKKEPDPEPNDEGMNEECREICEECREICEESKDHSFLKFEARISLARMGKNKTLRGVELDTGISNAYLSQLESGKIRKPSFEVVKKLCWYYDIDIRTV